MRSDSSPPRLPDCSAPSTRTVSSRTKSASVSLTASSVRPGRPWLPRRGGTLDRRTGASGASLSSPRISGPPAHGLTGEGLNSACSALLAHPLRSLLRTECPTSGTTSRCESGICAETSRAFSVGVRRSSAPLRISVGTLGNSSRAGAGAGAVYGQNAHAGMSLIASTLLGANGAIRLAPATL